MKTPTTAVADSGAQYDVWSLQEYLAAGYLERDLHTVSLSLNAANKSPIHIAGAFFADVTGISADGTPITTSVMLYVSKDVKGFYISETTMFSLGMLPKNFPTPGCALPPEVASSSDATPPAEAPTQGEDDTNPPPRRPVPPNITVLPFPCTTENIPKMKKHLLEYYKYSVFNNRSLDPLPEMAGPPL